jgi:hypothetical protein
MADDEIGGGLLGSASKFGGDVWSGLSGLLGGGVAPTAGQQQDMMASLSPEDQRRLGLSMLGQLGATLLSAGQRQTGAQRAEKLAQLGNIGTNMEQSIARSAMLQQQRIAAQRQAELFAPQLTTAKALAAEKEIALAQTRETVAAQENLRKLRDANPEALAKDLGIDNVGLIKTMPIDQLLTITKEVAVKKAMRSPLELAAQAEIAKAISIPLPGVAAQPMALAAAPMQVAAPPAQVAPSMPTMTAPGVGIPSPADNMALDYSQYPETGKPPAVSAPVLAAPQQMPPAAPAQTGGVVSMPTPTNPEAARLRALASNPLISAADPAKAKAFAELADKIEPPGAIKGAEAAEVKKAEMRFSQPKVEQALAGQALKTENAVGTIDRAISRVDNWSAGYGSLLSYIPQTQARNLQADIATIKANIGFDELQRMRDASPTGGALGQVAVQELNYLQAAVANLDQAQSPTDLQRALKDIRTNLKGYQTLREKAYEKDYGQKFDMKKVAGEDMGGGKEQPQFKSADEVKAAVQSGALTRDQALQILRSKFGFE